MELHWGLAGAGGHTIPKTTKLQRARSFSQVWNEHFEWADDEETIIGPTPIGRATVETLDMNSELRRATRSFWFDAE
jgi:hypothetical protein